MHHWMEEVRYLPGSRPTPPARPMNQHVACVENALPHKHNGKRGPHFHDSNFLEYVRSQSRLSRYLTKKFLIRDAPA